MTNKGINDIGLSDDDLLNLRGFLEGMAADEGMTADQVKEQFFHALGLYKDISGFEERKEAEADQMEGLAKEKSVLSGEIPLCLRIAGCGETRGAATLWFPFCY